MENSIEVFLKTKNWTTVWPSNPIPGHIPGENHNSKRFMPSSAHCSTIYNCQDMKATKFLSTEKWIKKLWYTYTMEYYSAIKRNKTVSFAEMWIDLETVIQNEVSQKETILNVNAYMWNLEKWYRWSYLQSRNRDTYVEKKHMDTKGEDGWDDLGVWGWHIYTAAAAAAAKLLQSCPTLCDPIDGSPPGSPIPGILKARTLEWVAISFSNAWKWKVKSESEVQSSPTLSYYV